MTGAWRALAFAACLPAAQAALPADAALALHGPGDAPLVLEATVDLSTVAASDRRVTYPGPNAAVFIGAVLVHGAVAESQRATQRDRLRRQAEVAATLEREAMGKLRMGELLRRALEQLPWQAGKKLLAEATFPAGAWTVSVLPRYAVSADRLALILDGEVALVPPGQLPSSAHVVQVRVVSRPRSQEEARRLWEDGGTQAHAEAVSMLVHALDLALRRPATAPADVPFRTLRYTEGAALKMERAQPELQACGRHVMRTLRGWLLSAPTSDTPEAASCEPALPGWR